MASHPDFDIQNQMPIRHFSTGAPTSCPLGFLITRLPRILRLGDSIGLPMQFSQKPRRVGSSFKAAGAEQGGSLAASRPTSVVPPLKPSQCVLAEIRPTIPRQRVISAVQPV
jgi:hypothetical protein